MKVQPCAEFMRIGLLLHISTTIHNDWHRIYENLGLTEGEFGPYAASNLFKLLRVQISIECSSLVRTTKPC